MVNELPHGCYYIARDYLDFLREHDNEHIPRADYEDDNRARKFYFGPVINDYGVNYFVPVSHETNKGDMCIFDKETKMHEQYGLYLMSDEGDTLGNLDFRFMVPCQDNNLLELFEPTGYGARQAEICHQMTKDICDTALHTYNLITSGDYPQLSKDAVDFAKANDAMYLYDDIKDKKREPISCKNIESRSIDIATDDKTPNPTENISSAPISDGMPKGHLAQRFAKIDTNSVSEQNIVKTTDRQPSED